MKESVTLNTTCSLVSANTTPDFPDHASWNEVGGVWEEAEELRLLRVSSREWQNVLCEGEMVRVCQRERSHDYQLTSSLANSLHISCRSWGEWVWLARAHRACPRQRTAALSITLTTSLCRCSSAGVKGRGDFEGDFEGVFAGDFDLGVPDPLW